MSAATAPTRVLDLDSQFSRLSLSSSTPPSSAPSSAQPPMHPRVLAFFQEQDAIGRQPAPEPLQKKYPDETYRLADQGAIASVDSDDWRLREISVKATEAIIDLFDKEFRTPMLAGSVELLATINKETLKEKLKENVLIRIPQNNVPNMPQTERSRFVISDKGLLYMAVPKATVISIAQRCDREFAAPTIQEEVGPAFLQDLNQRTETIFQELFRPEKQAISSLESDPKMPKITIHKTTPFDLLSAMEIRIAQFVGRQLVQSRQLDPDRTSSLLKGHLQTLPDAAAQILQVVLRSGDTFHKHKQTICW